MVYKVHAWGKTYSVYLEAKNYQNNGNLAIQLYDAEDWCPFATITVNLKKLPDGMAYVDTNNCPWAVEFLEKNGLAKFADDFGFSGYCVYPLYRFNMEKLGESEDSSEREMNSMCNDCALLGEECDGTYNQVWTGCVYKESIKKR